MATASHRASRLPTGFDERVGVGMMKSAAQNGIGSAAAIALAAVLCASGIGCSVARAQQQNLLPNTNVPSVQPHEQQPRPYFAPAPKGGGTGMHLRAWMLNHQELTPQQQQQALEREPGFRQLTPEQQRRALQRLAHLNSLPVQQRDRILANTEAMERLTPEQRGEVRNAMGLLGALPQDRRIMVARAFRTLRGLPVPERNALLNSDLYRSQFSDEERGTLGNLLAVSPLLPTNH